MSEREEEKEVAIKELFLEKEKNFSLTSEKFSEFSHEVSIMSQLSHPNIVTLFGITTHPKLRIVMEYFCLPDLRSHLSSELILPPHLYTPKLKLLFCLDIIKALEFMHGMNPVLIFFYFFFIFFLFLFFIYRKLFIETLGLQM